MDAASALAGVNDLDGGGLGDAMRESPVAGGPVAFCCCLFLSCTQWKPYASISCSSNLTLSRTIARARAAFAALSSSDMSSYKQTIQCD